MLERSKIEFENAEPPGRDTQFSFCQVIDYGYRNCSSEKSKDNLDTPVPSCSNDGL